MKTHTTIENRGLYLSEDKIFILTNSFFYDIKFLSNIEISEVIKWEFIKLKSQT